MMNASGGRGYYSKHLMTAAVVAFYGKSNLWPKGISERAPAIAEWSSKNGSAMARLVPCPCSLQKL